MKIILGGVVSLPPYNPGQTWLWLHYILGFQELGHEVFFVEEVSPNSCVDVQGRKCDFEHCVNRDLFRDTMQRFGLMDRACLIYDRGKATLGLSLNSLNRISTEADLLINMSGCLKTDFVLNNVKRLVYVDLDPVYTQLWCAEYGVNLGFDMYDVFFSVGINIGTPYSPIPDCGVNWQHTLRPVVLKYWPVHIDASCKRFSTIASLKSFGDLRYDDDWYGSKYEEFNRLVGLPRKTEQEFEVALKYYRELEPGLQLFKDNGWFLCDANEIADLSKYQSYIARSRAEIGIVQNAYIKACSGWFSERWSHFLASGKPVLAQSTGFERWVPTGRGLLSFRTLEEAVTSIDSINQDYEAHCRAARELAEEYLDYRKVLPKMLEACIVS